MSSQRGNVRKQAPKHQNGFAFKHNPKSKKTNYILSLPNEGLCQRCHDQIEWRKSYRKYKPLTKPSTWYVKALNRHCLLNCIVINAIRKKLPRHIIRFVVIAPWNIWFVPNVVKIRKLLIGK